jgi:DNA-binding PadR family transcriptional regulator
MNTAHLKRACTETLIIKLLEDGPLHGYEMAKEVERRSGGYFVFKHSTLYPVLHRMEKQGLITGEWTTGEGGNRPRKYYALTRAGRKAHTENTAALKNFFRVMTDLMPEVAG